MFQIIQNRKIWLTFSGILVGLSVAALAVWGLNFGIDFTGGALLEVEFSGVRPSVTEVSEAMADLPLGDLIPQPVGDKGMILRFKNIDEQAHQDVLAKLNELAGGGVVIDNDSDVVAEDAVDSDIEDSEAVEMEAADEATSSEDSIVDVDVDVDESAALLTELRYDSVGPVIGEELKSKSIQAMIIVLIAIILFIAWAFQKVSKPVESWKYGLTAIFALFHDVLITMGVFAVLGKFYDLEINTPFVAAILTVLGYSVNDTIVVFDRIRENLPKSDDDFEATVNTSVNQTIRRSINTSLTTFVVLISIVIWGGETIRGFVLALSVGVLIGTYSSIFLASPLLVLWEKMKK